VLPSVRGTGLRKRQYVFENGKLVYELCGKHAVGPAGWKNFGLVDSLHRKYFHSWRLKSVRFSLPSPLTLCLHLKFQTVSYGKTQCSCKRFENAYKEEVRIHCHYTSSVHSSTRSRWKWSALRPGHFTRRVRQRPPIEYGTETDSSRPVYTDSRSPHFGGHKHKHLIAVAIEKRFRSCPDQTRPDQTRPDHTQVRAINMNARTIAVNCFIKHYYSH
jgi:hypothetical protein